MHEWSDWYWIVGGDTSRAWSSQTSGWVTEWPSDRTTRIGSDAELNEVMESVGRRGPLVAARHVKSECQRRILALTGTPDIISCIIKQSNANMRANELNDKRLNGDTLTEAEAGEADALRNLGAAIKALRARSNDIENLDPIPLDYIDEARWSL